MVAAPCLDFGPANIMRAQGLEPDPWQQDLFDSSDGPVLLNCSRQSGKSTTLAALALHTALAAPDSLVLIGAPSLRQSTELFRKVKDGYRAVAAEVEAVSMTQVALELENGSRILSLPGSEATLRGLSAPRLLIIDEAARVPDDLYRGLRPMLAVSRGRLVCLSTPFGRRGFFWHEWENGGPAWRRVRIPWQQCPRITPEFIAEETRSLGPSWVRQEYECSFEALEGLVYPDFEERTAVENGPDDGRRFGGIDFGFRNPFAAIWGRLDRDNVFWVEGERYGREIPLQQHIPFLPKENITWLADPSGLQDITTLNNAGLVVRRGNNNIRDGISRVRSWLETGRLKVVRGAAPNLLAEARLYRYPTRIDGHPDSEVPVDEHNHALSALRYLLMKVK